MMATTTTLWHGGPPPAPPRPISVDVMAESLCIDCQRFFTKSLVPTYRTLGPSVMNLRVVPYGNSRMDPDQKTVTCQHGEAECDANVWEQCAVDQYPPTVYMDFFECLESGVLPMGHRDERFDESVFEQCAAATTTAASKKKVTSAADKNPSTHLRATAATVADNTSSMDFAKLKACHDNPDTAWSMQEKYAKLTPADHTYVPWVLVDHQLIDVDQQDLLQAVCQAYTSKGGSHPACASSSEK